MNSYVFDIGEKARKVARFIGHVRAELQRALVVEKASRKLTQQQIATMIGVHRSVINRQLMGFENLTLRRVAELAWALGWELYFELRRPQQPGTITVESPAASTSNTNIVNLQQFRQLNADQLPAPQRQANPSVVALAN